jgi:hypothetical protein
MSREEFIKCDECGKRQTVDGLIGWLELKRPFNCIDTTRHWLELKRPFNCIDTTRHGDKPLPAEFCGPICMFRYIADDYNNLAWDQIQNT